MTSLSKKEEIETLKVAISSLSKVLPLTKTISTLLEKNFKQINQSEAYEVLRYLVNACVKEKQFKFVDQKVWKGLDADSKVTVEKFKKDILEAIKNISMKRKVIMPVLKKSELMVPSCPNFFKCCLALSSYALSFQLSLKGIQFWPATPTNLEIKQATRKEIISITEEVNALQNNHLEINKQIEMTRHDLNLLEEKKLEISCMVETLIQSSTNVSADCLKDAKIRDEYIKSLAKKTDDLHEKNLKRLKVLKRLDESIQFLIKFIESGHEKILIDGKDLLPLISYETQVFADKEGIKLFENGLLSLEGLFSVVKSTLAECKGLNSNISKVLELKSPECRSKFVTKLERMKEGLDTEVAVVRCKLGHHLNHGEEKAWLDNFFIPVPQLSFSQICDPLVTRDPVVDLEKIDKLIAIKENKKTKGRCIPKLMVSQENSSVRGITRSLRRRSMSADRMVFPFSAKAESTRYLRDQQSFKNSKQSQGLGKSLLDISFRNTSATKVTEESVISSIENVLSPTSRHIEEMHFSGEITISPISHASRKNSVFSDKEDFFSEVKPRDSVASTSFTFSSPSNFWNEESSRNDTRDTFDSSSGGFPAISDISSSSLEA